MSMWARRLKEAMDEAGMGKADLARRSGVPYDSVSKYVDGGVEAPRGDRLKRLAEALEVNRLWLTEGVGPKRNGVNLMTNTNIAEPSQDAHSDTFQSSWPRDVPVYGTAAGNDAGAVQLNEGEVVDLVRRPPGLVGARRVYGLYVVGDSMVPKFEPGELIYVHPDRPCRPGDYVVVQIQAADHEPAQTFVKRLKRRTERVLHLTQFNPETTMELDSTRVVAIHRILTTNELFGV